MSAVEYRATPHTSLVVQSLLSGPVARHCGDFSDRTVEFAVGVKHRIGRDLLLETSVVENLVVYGNGADVAFHAGLTWRSEKGRGWKWGEMTGSVQAGIHRPTRVEETATWPPGPTW